jgi:lysozyme
MSVLLGIDVSGHQGVVDYDKVKAAGISFVIAKATEGHTYIDPYYWANKKAIKAAGLIPGAYHFLRPLNGGNVADQADFFCTHADPDAIHALDVEASGPLDVAGWMKAYRRHYPHKAVLMYTGRDLWRNTSKVPYDGAEFGPLWAAGYLPNRYVTATGSLAHQWQSVTGNAGLPWLGWTAWTIMQFTDHGSVPGVSGGVDGNAFGGTLDDLKKLAAQSQEDEHMSAQDVQDLKNYIDSKIDDLAKAVWDFQVGSAWDGDTAQTAGKALRSAQRYSIEDGVEMDRPAGNNTPGTPTLAKQRGQQFAGLAGQLAGISGKVDALTVSGVKVNIDPEMLAHALAAALASSGGVVTADAVRQVLVEVLAQTRLSATPPA